ncbi:hypothetical protein NFI96_007416 [Prochilodus magdalenae]|nr:hypothetical protein NFI96_007416 [Prochilodus magdalenae]
MKVLFVMGTVLIPAEYLKTRFNQPRASLPNNQQHALEFCTVTPAHRHTASSVRTTVRCLLQCEVSAAVYGVCFSVGCLLQCEVSAAVYGACCSVRCLLQCEVSAAVCGFCCSVRCLLQCEVSASVWGVCCSEHPGRLTCVDSVRAAGNVSDPRGKLELKFLSDSNRIRLRPGGSLTLYLTSTSRLPLQENL